MRKETHHTVYYVIMSSSAQLLVSKADVATPVHSLVNANKSKSNLKAQYCDFRTTGTLRQCFGFFSYLNDQMQHPPPHAFSISPPPALKTLNCQLLLSSIIRQSRWKGQVCRIHAHYILYSRRVIFHIHFFVVHVIEH